MPVTKPNQMGASRESSFVSHLYKTQQRCSEQILAWTSPHMSYIRAVKPPYQSRRNVSSVLSYFLLPLFHKCYLRQQKEILILFAHPSLTSDNIKKTIFKKRLLVAVRESNSRLVGYRVSKSFSAIRKQLSTYTAMYFADGLQSSLCFMGLPPSWWYLSIPCSLTGCTSDESSWWHTNISIWSQK